MELVELTFVAGTHLHFVLLSAAFVRRMDGAVPGLAGPEKMPDSASARHCALGPGPRAPTEDWSWNKDIK